MKKRQDRLRRLAERAGFALRKSRSKIINADDLGDYMLIDATHNCVVLGSRFDATLDDIEAYLK